MYDVINEKNIKRGCFARLCNPKQVGYISTIGVIDELRNLGVGKILLSKAIFVLKLKKNCIGVYLHVIKHNKSAINFYESNEFFRGKYLENFYFIQKNYYDSVVFFKLFNSLSPVYNKIDVKNSNYEIISNKD